MTDERRVIPDGVAVEFHEFDAGEFENLRRVEPSGVVWTMTIGDPA